MQALFPICLLDERLAILMHQNPQTSNFLDTCIQNTLHKISFANLEWDDMYLALLTILQARLKTKET